MKLSVFGPTVGLLLLCGLMTGCGASSGPEVRGVVTLDGQPLADAELVFRPASDLNLPSAVTTTDAEGNFEIAPDEDTGATLQPGQYKVTVSKKVVREGATIPQELEGDIGQLEVMGLLRETILPQYSSEARTSLVADIKEEPNELQYDLTSK